jgi:hypothetical protein
LIKTGVATDPLTKMANRQELITWDYRVYKDRDRTTRMLNQIKQLQKFATPHDKSHMSFAAVSYYFTICM